MDKLTEQKQEVDKTKVYRRERQINVWLLNAEFLNYHCKGTFKTTYCQL